MSATEASTTQPLNQGGVDDDVDDELSRLRSQIQREKAAKRKMYSYLVRIADELKELRAESDQLIDAADYARKVWYEGGMWRGPNVLPMAGGSAPDARGGGGTGGTDAAGGSERTVGTLVPRAPVSLTDLFLGIVTVTAFSRVGSAIQDTGLVSLPSFAYFVVFWQIWSKEASYGTRFDATDVSGQVETLLCCFALLGGSLSAYGDFDGAGCTRVMGTACFVSLLHAALHARVYWWFKDAGREGLGHNVRRYAVFITTMNALEAVTWGAGMAMDGDSGYRGWVFLVAILLNMRLPQGILPNDFHAACTKRSVLFILLLGFNLQTIVGVASPFFNYWEPAVQQYGFLFLACFLLFTIKLLYVDDTYSIQPQDHALLYNRTAGFFFHMGNLSLLFATTVLGAGLNLLTHSFLAAAAALPSGAKSLVCGGFSAVVFSIAFIKSMHVRRVPSDPKHERMFCVAYSVQVVGVAAVTFITARMCFASGETSGLFPMMVQNEFQTLGILVFLSVLLIIISWLDEMVELRLYRDAAEASEFRVNPFGIWTCFKNDEALQLEALVLERNRRLLAQRSPLLGSSVMNLTASSMNLSASTMNLSSTGSMYNSFANSPPQNV